MYANYSYQGQRFYDTNVQYSYLMGNDFSVSWTLGETNYHGTWTENALTGMMSNQYERINLGFGHTPLWIDTEILSIGDVISITVEKDECHLFRVESFGESYYGLSINYCFLTDITTPGDYLLDGCAFYEDSTGLLLNGIFCYGEAYFYFYSLTLEVTNAGIDLDLSYHSSIPGFDFIYIIGIFALMSIAVIFMQKKRRKLKS